MEEMQDKVELYQTLSDALKRMAGNYVYLGKPGEGYTDIRELLPDETAKRICKGIIREMNVEMIALRNEIRKALDEDEAEQLQLAEEEETVFRFVDQITPKNDYRRQQNCQEEDDGK